MTSDRATYLGFRFPAEIIGHAVWLYHVFNLSLRDEAFQIWRQETCAQLPA